MVMLITTSRKPSPRTRSFARSMERILESKYVNRGKMSMRDVLLKSISLGYKKTALISEIKGNPSRVDFLNQEGDLILSLNITASNSPRTGRVNKKNLRLRWELEKHKSTMKDQIISLIEIPEENESETVKGEQSVSSDSNLVKVREGKANKVVVDFYDQQGQLTGPRIYISQCKCGG